MGARALDPSSVTMDVYWYWPFTREENFPLADEVRRRVDGLTVSTISRPGAWTGTPEVQVLDQLPGVNEGLSPSVRWAIDRARGYVGRVHRRRAEVEHHDPDLVHVWYANTFTDAFDLHRLAARQPTVLHVHDIWPHNLRVPRSITRRALQRIYHAPQVLVVYHDRLAQALVDDFDVPVERIRVLPLMVPPERAPAIGTTPACDDTPTVLFFGTLRNNKGVRELLEAINLVTADVRWIIAGRGEPVLEDLVRRTAESQPNLEARLGWVDADGKAALFGAAELVVLPYTSFASQSAVLHDAYSHGRPVVVTDVGALGSTVLEDQTGWVTEPGDGRRIAATVSEALRDSRSRSVFAGNAARIAEERSPKNVAAQLVDVYFELLGRSS